MKLPIVVRVGVLILDKNKILLAKISGKNGDFFVLPGGGLEAYESLIECGVREVKEETNLDVEILRILYIKEMTSDINRCIEFVLEGKIIDGTLKLGDDPDHEFDKKNLIAVKFYKISKIKDMNFHPKQLKTLLEKDIQTNFSQSCGYLGKFLYPE